MKFANLLYASFVAVIAICANAINSQQQRENSLLQFNSAADVRSYFEDIATAKTDAELLKRYQQLLKDKGVAPLIAKGNAIPIRNGGQIIVDGDSLRTKDKDGHTIEMPSNGTALAALNNAGAWTQLPLPDKTTSLLIRSESGIIVVDLKDGVVSRLNFSPD
jgi:hypothetical protein